jgi:hypothetical protein
MNLRALHNVTDRLCEIVDALSASFPRPAVVKHGEGFVERHAPLERTNGLAAYLKVVKACSTLNGALTLLDGGYVQEAYALGRIVMEQVEDSQFFVIPRDENVRLTKHQTEALDEFYQEEFTDAGDPIGSSQERHRVRREKVRAAIHQDIEDPSTAGAITKALNRVFSGYIHGAYVHVMELHSNTPGRYSLRGGQGHHLTEAIDYFPQFVFSTALAVELLVSRTPDRDDLMPHIRALREEIGKRFDLLLQPKK